MAYLDDVLNELWDSTTNFYERFPEARVTDENVINGVTEETAEYIRAFQSEPLTNVCQEMADAIVVMMNGVRKRGGTVHDIAQAIIQVARKNDAKNANTHYWDADKAKICRLKG